MNEGVSGRLRVFGIHAVLLAFTASALFPIFLVVNNSFKNRRAIFSDPYSLPNPDTWDLIGYQTVFQGANFGLYFMNSLTVTVISLLLILLSSAMAAFALSEYRFRGNTLLGLYMAVGIMIPIRLGTVSIIKLMVNLGLNDTLWALILVYTATGIPLAVFILSVFLRNVPGELKDAARIDGASEYRIFWMILPLVRPALGTVAVYNLVPIWNDLWFPLIFITQEDKKTVLLAVTRLQGQYATDWPRVFALLTLSALPVILLYLTMSKQFVAGLTAGAVKG